MEHPTDAVRLSRRPRKAPARFQDVLPIDNANLAQGTSERSCAIPAAPACDGPAPAVAAPTASDENFRALLASVVELQGQVKALVGPAEPLPQRGHLPDRSRPKKRDPATGRGKQRQRQSPPTLDRLPRELSPQGLQQDPTNVAGPSRAPTGRRRGEQPVARTVETLSSDDYSAEDLPQIRPLRKASKRKRSARTPSPDIQSSGESNHSLFRSDDSDSDADYSSFDKPTLSYGSLIGSNVEEKLRRKILTNRFLEMSELLPKYNIRKQQELLLKTGKSDSVRLVRRPERYDIPFDNWLEAFDVYTSIHMEKAKNVEDILKLTRSLLTYKKEVTTFKRQGGDWAGYDRHYRHDRQTNPTSWATTRQDLLQHYQRPVRDASQGPQRDFFRGQTKPDGRRNTKSQDGPAIPYGYCVAFHSSAKRCDYGQNCTYKHVCPRCGRRHPGYQTCGAAPSRTSMPPKTTGVNSSAQPPRKPANAGSTNAN
jgi:hypothetical protein